MIRTGRIALVALLALAATGAEAQWRAEPMTVWLEAPATVLVGNYSAATAGADLLVVNQPAARAEVRPYHALLTRQASAFAFPWLSQERALRGGLLAQNGGDALADVARVSKFGGAVEIAFGNAPGTLRSYAASYPLIDEAASFVHLLPRTADVLVVPYYPGDPTLGAVTALDFSPAALSTTASRTWPIPPARIYDRSPPDGFEAVPLRVSSVARANGLDDVALLGAGGVVLFVHDAVPATSTLAGLQLSPPIEVGGSHGPQYPPPWSGSGRPPWIPATVAGPGDTLGVAVVDVDQDGDLDLVLAQSILSPDASGEPTQGAVVWVEGTGNPADFGDPLVAPWHDLGLELGLSKPLVVRQVEVAGAPAAAIWDFDLQEVVVVWKDAAGARGTFRAPAPGTLARDILVADLVGSPAQDLVVVMQDGAAGDTVLVYPDLGLPAPQPSWAPGSPGAPARGLPHPMAVLLDPSGPTSVIVEWIEGAVTSAPVGTGLSHVFPPVCTFPPPPLVITVRATDATGVFAELRTTLPLATLQPAIALAGATSPGRLVLPPGGTTAVFDGTAATGCGAASWGGTLDPAALGTAISVTDTSGPGWLRRAIALPEEGYPALLADPELVVSLATTDANVLQRVVTLRVELDASGLVDVTHAADRAALGDGELTVVRTRLRSRLGAALTRVRVVDVLAGLAPAGAPVVSGASVLSVAADGADLVLDVLPAAPAEVTIELPVRAVAARRASSAVAASSSGGWLLTPRAGVDAATSPLPGCGCGAGSAPGALALLALALAGRRRRAT